MYMLAINNMSHMQYMQYGCNGCIYVHVAIHKKCMKYLGPFWTESLWICQRAQWMSARVLGKSPARSSFAGKVSECVCVCVRARKAPSRAAFATAESTAAAFHACTCTRTLQRVQVLDQQVSTAGVIGRPCSALSSSSSLEIMSSTLAWSQ